MSDKLRILYYALWIAHPLLQLGIAAALVHRRLHNKFRFFFAYIVTQVATFAVMFPTHLYYYPAYEFVYWFSIAVSAVLGFAVIHEVFLDVFRPFHTLRDLGTVLFKWAGIVMLLVAGVVSISTRSGELAPWMQAITTSHRCVRLVQVGMVLFLLFFARFLGVSRRQHSFGIALGFGAFATVELTLIASWVGKHLENPALSLINMSAYNVALITWLTYALARNRAREVSNTLFQSQRWEQSLTDIHHPVPENSLIPMFEGMVDRALSRTPNVADPRLGGLEIEAVPQPTVAKR